MARRKLGFFLICSSESLISRGASIKINLNKNFSQTISRMSTQRYRICANVDFMFHENPDLKYRYQEAHRLGFKGVETGNPYGLPAEELAGLLFESGMDQALINTPVGDVSKGEVGFASLPGKESQFLDGLKTAIHYATTLKCGLIHIMAGLLDENKIADHDSTYIANLKKAAPLLEKAGIVGVIEPINSYSVPRYYLSNYTKAVSVIESVNSKNIGLLLDIFHLQQIKGDVTHTLKELVPHVKHIQVAQVPDRHEPNSPGELNYEYVFQLLNEVGYKKWVGLEYKPAGNPGEGLKWVTEFGIKL